MAQHLPYAGPLSVMNFYIVHVVLCVQKEEWAKRKSERMIGRGMSFIVIPKEEKKQFFFLLEFFDQKIKAHNILVLFRLRRVVDEGSGSE